MLLRRLQRRCRYGAPGSTAFVTTGSNSRCGRLMSMLLAVMIVLVTIGAVEAEEQGFTVSLKRNNAALTEDLDAGDVDSALSSHFRKARQAHQKYRKRGFSRPTVLEHSTTRSIGSLLWKRDDGNSAIAPGGGPKVGKDVWGAITPTFNNSLGVDQDGNDFAYFAFIQIGSAKTPFKLLLDTGSSNTWISGAGCTAGACSVMKQLTTDISPSLQTTNSPFYIQYGTGAVVGTAALDVFHFAGFSIATEFGLANRVSDSFLGFTIDGVLGLGPEVESSSDSGNNLTTIMEAMVQQKAIERKIYGVALARASDGDNDGVINFGNLDSSMYQGELEYTDTKKGSGFWEIPISGVKIGDVVLNLEGAQRTAIVDTGTALFFAPAQDAIQLHAAIPDSQIITTNFIIPCNTTVGISIAFGSTSYSIPPIDFIGPPISLGSEYCLSLIGPLDMLGTSTWLLGAVFLKNVYTAFDLEAYRVGFAQREPPQDAIGSKRTAWTTLEAQYMTPVASLTAARGLSPTGVVTNRVSGGNRSGEGTSEGVGAAHLKRSEWCLGLVAAVMAWILVG